MRKWNRLIIYAIGVAALAAALGACGTTASTGKTYCIGTDLPVSGSSASDGKPTENGARLAVNQNKDLGGGNTLQIRTFDDVTTQAQGADPNQGAANVQTMVNTSCVMAMVGAFNSGVSAAEMPITAKANLAQISPANTNPGLTLKEYAAARGFNFDNLHPAGFPINYFRLPANDVVQGKVDADLTYNPLTATPPGLGAHSVYLVDDATPYGSGLADYFKLAYTADGGTILGRSSITAGAVSQFPQLADTIIATHPDAVMYGGVRSAGAGLLDAQLVGKGYKNAFVGGDGIANDPGMIMDAGPASANMFGSTAAPDTSQFTGSTQTKFLSDYKAAYTDAAGVYSGSAYDAAMIEITVIKKLIADGKDVTRLAVLQGIQGIQYTGVTGSISFDANGDNAGNKVFSIYDVKSGAWAFLEEVKV